MSTLNSDVTNAVETEGGFDRAGSTDDRSRRALSSVSLMGAAKR